MCIESILKAFTPRSTTQIPVPADIIDQDGVTYDENAYKVTIDLNFLNIPFTKKAIVRITTVQDTNSMLPVFDALHTCILIRGRDATEQKIMLDWLAEQPLKHSGNIMIYVVGAGQIIHRVVKVSEDSQGRYWTFKGDHTLRNDRYKVRDEDIESLLFVVAH